MPSGIVLDIRNLADLHDDSRNHHTITNNNAIPVRGIHGRGMDFNGTTAYLDCGNHSSLNITNAITIEAWVKPNVLSGNRDVCTKEEAYHIRVYNDELRMYGYSAGSYYYSRSVSLLSLNEYFYIASTYDSNDGIRKVKLFSNGVEVSYASQDVLPGALNINTNSVNIGSWDGTANYFNGTIDNIKIYNRALDIDEIKLHYRQQSPYYQEEAPTICL